MPGGGGGGGGKDFTPQFMCRGGGGGGGGDFTPQFICAGGGRGETSHPSSCAGGGGGGGGGGETSHPSSCAGRGGGRRTPVHVPGGGGRLRTPVHVPGGGGGDFTPQFMCQGRGGGRLHTPVHVPGGGGGRLHTPVHVPGEGGGGRLHTPVHVPGGGRLHTAEWNWRKINIYVVKFDDENFHLEYVHFLMHLQCHDGQWVISVQSHTAVAVLVFVRQQPNARFRVGCLFPALDSSYSDIYALCEAFPKAYDEQLYLETQSLLESFVAGLCKVRESLQSHAHTLR